MRRMLVVFMAICCSAAQPDVKVTYLATQASVQDIVRTMAGQAGLGYNWQKSFDQTDPLCRRWVRDVRIEAIPFGTAMQQILDPVGLRYEMENGEVVLYRAPNALPPADILINYSTDKKSVQYVAIDLAAKIGLGYNWNKSFAQTDPQCRRWVRDVRIAGVPFGTAMQRILDPVGLRYEIENGEVVLYRGPNTPPQERTRLSVAPSGMLISYSTRKKSVESIVSDLAAKVGLWYNRDKSSAQTDPECRRYVYKVSIKNEPFETAMTRILGPIRLRYQVEDDQVVLYRRQP